MLDPKKVAKAFAPQLTLGKNELSRLANRIQEDYRNALSDHEARMRRFQRYYMRWRGRSEQTESGAEGKSNYRVPLTQWQVYAKLAKEMASLFGADAEVHARPIGPNDQRIVRKVSCFCTWLVFSAMKIINPATVFNFRKILFGRAHAYAPWVRDTYDVPMAYGKMEEEVAYEGPSFQPLWPDDLIVPAEDVQSIHDFSFVLRKYRATPDELLDGEGTLYQGITDNFEQILMSNSQRRQRDGESEVVKQEKDISEGVIYEGNLSAANALVVHEWYGRWRKLKGKRDAREDSIEGREMRQSDLVVRYLPDLHLIIGVQDLAAMYPRKQKRRPFVEASLVKEGSYWGPSYGELLEDIETEMSRNHNMATDSGELGVSPVIFYKPGSGFDPDTFEYAPGTAIPSDDPASIKVVNLTADLQYPVMKAQEMLSFAERVTGITDMNIGRTQDRPNAPKTARATLALLEEGDTRAALEMTGLREDWGAIIVHFWELVAMFAPEKLFFRVTEEDADGLFDVSKGGTYMQADERGGVYDFELKFATNAWSKETEKQNVLALYQIDLQNPLLLQNARAMWFLLDKVHRAFGDDRFCDVIPQPPDLGLPVDPKEEYTRALQGEAIPVNPMDNDQLHLIDHKKRLDEMAQDPEKDVQAYQALIRHSQDHIEQFQQKKLMAELASRLASHMQQNSATGQGLLQQGTPLPLQQLHGTVSDLINSQQPQAPQAGPGKAA